MRSAWHCLKAQRAFVDFLWLNANYPRSKTTIFPLLAMKSLRRQKSCDSIEALCSKEAYRYACTAQLHDLIERPILKKIILLEKLTRWEVLCSQATDSNEIRQMKELFPGMFETYTAHTIAINHILYLLRDVHGIRVDHRKAQSQDPIDLTDVDAIISAGGDGTFLEAASLAQRRPDRKSWVFGINTDPSRSEGRLLMKPNLSMRTKSSMKSESRLTSNSHIDLPTYLLKLRTRDLTRLSRSKSTSYIDQLLADDEIENDQASSNIMVQEGKITEILLGIRQVIHRIVDRNYIPMERRRIRIQIMNLKPFITYSGSKFVSGVRTRLTSASDSINLKTTIGSDTAGVGGLCKKIEQDSNDEHDVSSPDLQHTYSLAVNEVLVTSLQSHMSFYVEIKIDGRKSSRSKNSGIIVCTGSGSSAWAYNISKISKNTIETVIEHYMHKQNPLVQQKLVSANLNEICDLINQHLIFDPSEPKMRLVVREPIENRVFSTPNPSLYGMNIEIKPLTQDAVVCIDGINVIPIQFGQRILLTIDNIDDCIYSAI